MVFTKEGEPKNQMYFSNFFRIKLVCANQLNGAEIFRFLFITNFQNHEYFSRKYLEKIWFFSSS